MRRRKRKKREGGGEQEEKHSEILSSFEKAAKRDRGNEREACGRDK